MTSKHKIVFLGDSSVGKTSLVERIIKNTFSIDKQSTVGVSFALYEQLFENGKKIVFEIWDTAGQEKYHSLAPIYYRNADVAVIVYDLTRKETYERALLWIKELNLLNKKFFVFLVGNKKDLEIKEQTETSVYETSAKTGEGIQQLLLEIGKRVEGTLPKRNGISLLEIEKTLDCCFFK